MEPLSAIAAAIIAGVMKRVTEVGYQTTRAITSRILDIATKGKAGERVPLQKSHSFEVTKKKLAANTDLTAEDIEILTQLAEDVFSSLDQSTRQRIIKQVDDSEFADFFAKSKFVNPVFSESIRFQLGAVDSAIDALTAEQFRVMKILENALSVQIQGSPGSGKTLMAVEKAIRMSDAGLKPIILCHSPKLRDHLKGLAGSSIIEIESFIEFCARIVSKNPHDDWNHYHNITDEDILGCIDYVKKSKIRYDCVIVDEAQDFEDDWWDVVLTLKRNKDSKVYIFSDDRQSLIEGRGNYPEVDIVCDMSRNCRNSGAVFDYMKKYDVTLPDTEPLLKNLGYVDSFFAGASFEENVARGVRSASNYGILSDTVILFGRGYEKDIEDLKQKTMEIDDKYLSVWRKILIRFSNTIIDLSKKKISPDFNISIGKKCLAEISALGQRLSYENRPSDTDREIISSAYKKIQRSMNWEGVTFQCPTGFMINHYGDLCLSGIDFSPKRMGPNDIATIINTINKFSYANWDFPYLEKISVTFDFGIDFHDPNVIECSTVEDFKGLERDGVIFFPDRYVSGDYARRCLVGTSRARKILIVFNDHSY